MAASPMEEVFAHSGHRAQVLALVRLDLVDTLFACLVWVFFMFLLLLRFLEISFLRTKVKELGECFFSHDGSKVYIIFE